MVQKERAELDPLMEVWMRWKKPPRDGRCPEISKSRTPLSSRWLEGQERKDRDQSPVGTGPRGWWEPSDGKVRVLSETSLPSRARVGEKWPDFIFISSWDFHWCFAS